MGGVEPPSENLVQTLSTCVGQILQDSLPHPPLTRLMDPVAPYSISARRTADIVPYIHDAGCSGRRHLSPTRRIKRRELNDYCQFLFFPVL